MKTLIKTGLVCAAAMWAPAAAMADPAGCDAGEIVIKFTHVTAERGHPKGEAAAELQRQVNASLDGRACMEVYPNSTLYADNDEMLQALLDGDVHLAAPSFSKLKRISPQVQLFDLPFLFQDLEHVINFTYTDEATALLEAGQDAGFRGLGYWMNGMSQMTAVREVRTPEDLNGLHFRMQGSAVEQAMFERMGATGEKLAFSKVYDALASGQVTAQANTWSNIYTKSFYTVQDSVTETNHVVLAYMVLTGDRWWNSLPEDVRTELELILLEVTHERNRFAYQLSELNRMNVAQDGGRVVALEEAERSAWVNTLGPIWAQFEDEIGPDLISAAVASGTATSGF
ncbi:MAG: DctP family TRAP transporter solute-binding subunit [Pseudomonadota bacterium]